MKILLINYEYPPLGGGGGVSSCNLAEAWARDGHEVHILTSQYKNLKKQVEKNGVKIFRTKIIGRQDQTKASLISLLSFPFHSILKGISLCKKNKYDIINTHFAIPSGPTGYVLSKMFKIKNILSIHGGDIYDPTKNTHNNPLLKSVIKFMLSTANQVVAQSKNTKENATRIYGIKKLIKIIPLGFVEPKFNKKNRQELNLEDNKFYLISTGRLVERKGYEYLIKSMPKNTELLLIGDGPEKQKLEALAEQENKKVRFLGYVSEEKKWQYLSIADCYVLSSLHEGYGIVCQEAMHVGLPIVATNFGGQTDFLKENENAILVKPKDIASLNWAINKIYQDKNLKQKLSLNNKRDIKNYLIDKIAQDYIVIFENET